MGEILNIMLKIKLQERDNDTPFDPTDRLTKEELNDNSCEPYTRSCGTLGVPLNYGPPNPIGRLRIPIPDNGRYEKNHPVFDDQHKIIGYLIDGREKIGYTFRCVYAGERFWIVHETLPDPGYKNGQSMISLICSNGKFMFSKKDKFCIEHSFMIEPYTDCLLYKLLDDGERLLLLTQTDINYLNVSERIRISHVKFLNEGKYFYPSSFALLEQKKLLAICGVQKKDPLTDEKKFSYSLRLYDLQTGLVYDEKVLINDHEVYDSPTNLVFSKDGRMLYVESGTLFSKIFELVVE